MFGCGVASGEITTTRNEAITPNSARAPAGRRQREPGDSPQARPNVVIWMSIWEKSDLVVDGKTLVAGTPAGEKEIMARMDAALARLTAGGAHVVLVTEAAPAPNPAQGTLTTSTKADDDGLRAPRTRCCAGSRRAHRGQVTLVDLATQAVPERTAVSRDGRRPARPARRPPLHARRPRPGPRAGS